MESVYRIVAWPVVLLAYAFVKVAVRMRLFEDVR
jgi:hypothetical protein